MSVLPVFFFAHYLSAAASLKSECIVHFRGKNITEDILADMFYIIF